MVKISKQILLDVIKNFARINKTKRYKNRNNPRGKYVGEEILTAVTLDFVSYIEQLNEMPVIFIEIFKKSVEKLGSDPSKIKELEEEIQKLKDSRD